MPAWSDRLPQSRIPNADQNAQREGPQLIAPSRRLIRANHLTAEWADTRQHARTPRRPKTILTRASPRRRDSYSLCFRTSSCLVRVLGCSPERDDAAPWRLRHRWIRLGCCRRRVGRHQLGGRLAGLVRPQVPAFALCRPVRTIVPVAALRRRSFRSNKTINRARIRQHFDARNRCEQRSNNRSHPDRIRKSSMHD
jgi:hypothetical protein